MCVQNFFDSSHEIFIDHKNTLQDHQNQVHKEILTCDMFSKKVWLKEDEMLNFFSIQNHMKLEKFSFFELKKYSLHMINYFAQIKCVL